MQITSYSSYMKKIAFTYNSCICMILFLPDFEVWYMLGGEWRVCRAFSSVEQEVEKRPNFLERYLATQLLSCPRGEFPSIRDVCN